MPYRATLAALALWGFTACKGPCRELSERLCDCEPTTSDKERCIQAVSTVEGQVEPTPEDEALCEERLKTCDCHTLDTAEGKRACGLAR